MKDIKPTKRQQDVLNFIREYHSEYLCAPTEREIAAGIGVKNHMTIRQHLRLLEQKGLLVVQRGVSRGISVIPETGNQLPLYGKVAAGLPLDIVANVDRMVTIPDELFKTKPDFLLKASGDSMVDAGIFDGDFVAIKHTVNVRNGEIVVATVDTDEMSRDERKECGLTTTGITIKRYVVLGNRIQLRSENRDRGYAPIVVKAERVRIEGRFVGLVRGS